MVIVDQNISRCLSHKQSATNCCDFNFSTVSYKKSLHLCNMSLHIVAQVYIFFKCNIEMWTVLHNLMWRYSQLHWTGTLVGVCQTTKPKRSAVLLTFEKFLQHNFAQSSFIMLHNFAQNCTTFGYIFVGQKYQTWSVTRPNCPVLTLSSVLKLNLANHCTLLMPCRWFQNVRIGNTCCNDQKNCIVHQKNCIAQQKTVLCSKKNRIV